MPDQRDARLKAFQLAQQTVRPLFRGLITQDLQPRDRVAQMITRNCNLLQRFQTRTEQFGPFRVSEAVAVGCLQRVHVFPPA
ncbi:hypothetical protein [uncultured Roseobacter sp.]|uniref:hypothetical protein n=1 Tax=uncultured Roseobacter sp. TaxID=114847 RepID=UPI00263504A7|nr:hypothetical protein [uncultured Roseobacter sp.]